ncbi:MAG TPA: hypothetical protein VFL97_04720 [Nitrococcus sp.]|nr:hypothetical protein [Nitrococcus sp.]
MTLGALLALPITTPAAASGWQAGPDPFAPFPVIGQNEMARLRGGFSLAGLDLEFGANVRTLIDNVVRLETIIHFTNAGIVTSQANLPQTAAGTLNTVGGAQLANAAQQTAGFVKNMATGAVNGGSVTANQANSITGLVNLADQIKAGNLSTTANGADPQPGSATTSGPAINNVGSGAAQLNLSGLGNDIRGVVLSDTKGLTAAIQNITQNQITSTIINQANDRQIQVQLNLQVDVKNFSQYSAALRSSLLNQRLAQTNRNL